MKRNPPPNRETRYNRLGTGVRSRARKNQVGETGLTEEALRNNVFKPILSYWGGVEWPFSPMEEALLRSSSKTHG